MALDSTHYLTLPDIKGRAGIGDHSDDATIEPAIKSTARAIDAYCGQFFYKLETATAREFAPQHACRVLTDPFWTTDDLVVAIDSADLGTYSTSLTAGDYALERFGGDLAYTLHPAGTAYDTVLAVGAYRYPTANHRPRSVRVTAMWGWVSVPDAVIEAAKIVATDLWSRKDTPFGIASGTVEFGGLRIGKDLMAQVASLLAPYRRVDRVLGIA
jgi:hypothetical protein